ncbi:Tuberous sclerosis 2-like protein [Dimargaris xerosporica]|nr:Tuberous sclerosis 2-like protein [Dimargaris xerosporica]
MRSSQQASSASAQPEPDATGEQSSGRGSWETDRPAAPPPSGRRPSRLFTSIRDMWSLRSGGGRDISHLQLSAQFSGISSDATPLDGMAIAHEVDPTVDLATRTHNITALCQFVQFCPVEHVEALWPAVADLVRPESPVEGRHLALDFMDNLIRGQYNRLGALRVEFYEALCRLKDWMDAPRVLRCLRQLTKDGKVLWACEQSIVPLVLWWLDVALHRKGLPLALASSPSTLESQSPLSTAVSTPAALDAGRGSSTRSPITPTPPNASNQLRAAKGTKGAAPPPPHPTHSTSSYITATLSSLFSGGSGTSSYPRSPRTPKNSAASTAASPLPPTTNPDSALAQSPTIGASLREYRQTHDLICTGCTLIGDIIKINSSQIPEAQIAQLIEYFYHRLDYDWCSDHVQGLVQILHHTMVFGHIPKPSIPYFFRLLCILVGFSDPDILHTVSTDIVATIPRTHYFYYAMQALTDILQSPADRPNVRLGHGAMYLLGQWVWRHKDPTQVEPYYVMLLRLYADLLQSSAQAIDPQNPPRTPASLTLLTADSSPGHGLHPLLVYNIMCHMHFYVEHCARQIITHVVNQDTADFTFRRTMAEWETVLLTLQRYIEAWARPRRFQFAQNTAFALPSATTSLAPLFPPKLAPDEWEELGLTESMLPPAFAPLGRDPSKDFESTLDPESDTIPRSDTQNSRPQSPAGRSLAGHRLSPHELVAISQTYFHLVLLYLMEIAHRLPLYFPRTSFMRLLDQYCRTCFVPDEIILRVIDFFDREGELLPTNPAWLRRMDAVLGGVVAVPVLSADMGPSHGSPPLTKVLARLARDSINHPHPRPDIVRHRAVCLLQYTYSLCQGVTLVEFYPVAIAYIKAHIFQEANPSILLLLVQLLNDLFLTSQSHPRYFAQTLKLVVRLAETRAPHRSRGSYPHSPLSPSPLRAATTYTARPTRRIDPGPMRLASHTVRQGASPTTTSPDTTIPRSPHASGRPRLSSRTISTSGHLSSPRSRRPSRGTGLQSPNRRGSDGLVSSLEQSLFTTGESLVPKQLLSYPFALSDLRPLSPAVIRAYAATYCLAHGLCQALLVPPSASATRPPCETIMHWMLRLLQRRAKVRLETRYTVLEVLLSLRATSDFRLTVAFPSPAPREPGMVGHPQNPTQIEEEPMRWDIYGLPAYPPLSGQESPYLWAQLGDPRRGRRLPYAPPLAPSSEPPRSTDSPSSTQSASAALMQPVASTPPLPPAPAPRPHSANSLIPSPHYLSFQPAFDTPSPTRHTVDLAPYLRVITRLLTEEASWAVFNLLLVRLAGQLQCMPLFTGQREAFEVLTNQLLKLVADYPMKIACQDQDQHVTVFDAHRWHDWVQQWCQRVHLVRHRQWTPWDAHIDAARPALEFLYLPLVASSDMLLAPGSEAPSPRMSRLTSPRTPAPSPQGRARSMEPELTSDPHITASYYAYSLLPHLLTYRHMLSKWQFTNLIICFGRGLQHILDDRVVMVCMHALQLACYEIPQEMTRELPRILASLNQLITMRALDVYILEFLSALARLPKLRANLVYDNYRDIFSIALKYIKSSNEMGTSWKLKEEDEAVEPPAQSHTRSPRRPPSPVRSPRLQPHAGPMGSVVHESPASSGAIAPSHATQHALSQYVLTLAYQVIDVWFMATKLRERPLYVKFIVSGLVRANRDPFQLDEATEMCIDMLLRYTYSNVALKPTESNQVITLLLMGPAFLTERAEHLGIDLDTELCQSAITTPSSPSAPSANLPSLQTLLNSTPRASYATEKTWIQKYGVITLTSSKFTAWTHVTIRRPSGVASMLLHLNNELKEFLEMSTDQSQNHHPSHVDVASFLLTHWKLRPDDVHQYLQSLLAKSQPGRTLSSPPTTSHVPLPPAPTPAAEPRSIEQPAPLNSQLKNASTQNDDSTPTASGRATASAGLEIRHRGRSLSIGKMPRSWEPPHNLSPLAHPPGTPGTSEPTHHVHGPAGDLATSVHAHPSPTLPTDDANESYVSSLYRRQCSSQTPQTGGRPRRSTVSSTHGRPTSGQPLAHHPPRAIDPFSHEPWRQSSMAESYITNYIHHLLHRVGTPYQLDGDGGGSGGDHPGGPTSIAQLITEASRPLGAASASTTGDTLLAAGHRHPDGNTALSNQRQPVAPTAAYEQLVDPEFLFSQITPHPTISHIEPPRPVTNDEAFQRHMRNLDRVAVIDFHKIGIVYVGPGKTQEAEILQTTECPSSFWQFLTRIGTLFELKDCKDIYPGGLDTMYGIDGEFSVYWKEDITQIVFHVPPLMPTNLERDPHCAFKKKHVGNDYVRIVYNDSGLPYRFDTIPSEFNFVNIVIEPLGRPDAPTLDPVRVLSLPLVDPYLAPGAVVVGDHASDNGGDINSGSSSDVLSQDGDDSDDHDNHGDGSESTQRPFAANSTQGSSGGHLSSSVRPGDSPGLHPLVASATAHHPPSLGPHYRIYLQRRPDMPEFSPLIEPKVVPADALAPFARQVAMHANVFTQVFLQSGVKNGTEYVSNWRERLRQIKIMKQRFTAPTPSDTATTNPIHPLAR